MADGDRLHYSLGLSYQIPYRQLCEGFVRPDVQARDLTKRVRRDLDRCYIHASAPLRAVEARLQSLSEQVLARVQQIDLRAESLILRQVAACSNRKRETELVVQSAQKVLCDIAEGAGPVDARESVRREFVQRLYNAQFGDVVLTPPQSVVELPPAELRDRLKNIEKHLRPQLDDLGTQLSRCPDGETPKLRLPARQRPVEKIDDLDVDMTDLHR